MDLSDELMMQKVKEGEVERLAILFERYHIELYNFFLKFSRDKALSSDLTQDVFYRILKYKNSYKKHKKFRTWMYMIARNTRIDAFKKNKIGNKSEGVEELRNVGTIQVLEIEEQESSELLKKALSQLNDEKRELIIMNFYQGMSTLEIADVLNISQNNTRVRFHRALSELRSIYNKISSL